MATKKPAAAVNPASVAVVVNDHEGNSNLYETG